MREVVASCEELEDKRGEDTENEHANGVRTGMIKWENLLPRMVLRVLLVEADDSTRQIVAALLRKCSYRVAAVSDGLKAWEVLKGRPLNIDLILTEVDLPSISGYALLSLMMEHDVCKNIPVIMMSSQDSVSTVYKCMLRGAADYLVKPIRRNELRNLWQHVWRRQSSLVGGSVPYEEWLKLDKVERTSENNAASNHASEDLAVQGCKGSDALSSCAKPETEAESSQLEGEDSILPRTADEADGKDPRMHHAHRSTSVDGCTYSFAIMESNGQRQPEATKKIFHGESISINESSSNNANPHLQMLELSLRGSQLHAQESTAAEERNMLRHSNASAFTRYTSRQLQPASANQSEVEYASQNAATYPQERVIPAVTAQAMTLDKLCTTYGSIFQAMCGKRPVVSPISPPSPRESTPNGSSSCIHHDSGKGNVSPNTDQTASSGFCKGINQYAEECKHGSRSVQREAALMKFRLKRKDRCYEKKVRYESRKKLAEQRPRMKGQFVRQQDITHLSKVIN